MKQTRLIVAIANLSIAGTLITTFTLMYQMTGHPFWGLCHMMVCFKIIWHKHRYDEYVEQTGNQSIKKMILLVYLRLY